MGRKDDFLEGRGMSKAEQHIATVNAANVPVSDFEGDSVPVTPTATYMSRGAQLLRNTTQHRAKEVHVKRAYGK
jgi:hypothetical protein